MVENTIWRPQPVTHLEYSERGQTGYSTLKVSWTAKLISHCFVSCMCVECLPPGPTQSHRYRPELNPRTSCSAERHTPEFQEVSSMFHGNFKVFSRVFQGLFKEGSRAFQESFQGVQKVVKDVQVCFLSASKVFRGSFKKMFNVFS